MTVKAAALVTVHGRGGWQMASMRVRDGCVMRNRQRHAGL